ncbi:thiamine phosphate synthase [Arthrospiribacter ruber]|uniref:thiamine phosphate synthase n=1 Tax=Arthrospiribacter ruber TaxID=2487934 RepID=UPI001C5AF14A
MKSTSDLELIVISSPVPVPNEADGIQQLFEAGMELFHLRKPDMDQDAFLKLLAQMDSKYCNRMAIHQHHDLADDFGIKRLHFTEWKRKNTAKDELLGLKEKGLKISTSIHDLGLLTSLSHFDYVFFSPVFDSLSKKGYSSSLESGFKLVKPVGSPKVMALGGVELKNLSQVKAMGFDGAAVLGAIWNQTEKERPKILQALMKKEINKLHYISQEPPFNSHLESILHALEAGCKWVQLRVKNLQEQEVLDIAKVARQLCTEHQAQLIINDYVTVAKEVNADGVHVGLNDMSVAAARQILGPDKIIGATANTIDQVIMHAKAHPDYIGIGPFRFTRTKEKLSPILGLEGYASILNAMNSLKINIPVIAVGGIISSDVPALLAQGVHGVAISGDINHATEMERKVEEIYQMLQVAK